MKSKRYHNLDSKREYDKFRRKDVKRKKISLDVVAQLQLCLIEA